MKNLFPQWAEKEIPPCTIALFFPQPNHTAALPFRYLLIIHRQERKKHDIFSCKLPCPSLLYFFTLAFCWTCLNIKALAATFASAESLNISALSSILAGTSDDFRIKHKFPLLNALATLFFFYFLISSSSLSLQNRNRSESFFLQSCSFHIKSKVCHAAINDLPKRYMLNIYPLCILDLQIGMLFVMLTIHNTLFCLWVDGTYFVSINLKLEGHHIITMRGQFALVSGRQEEIQDSALLKPLRVFFTTLVKAIDHWWLHYRCHSKWPGHYAGCQNLWEIRWSQRHFGTVAEQQFPKTLPNWPMISLFSLWRTRDL